MNEALVRLSVREAAKITCSRSGGPGGQNVNKVNTKVTLRVCLDGLPGLTGAEQERLREVLAGRLTGGGEIVLTACEERSQLANRERAFARLEALIIAAARLPKRRRPTAPSRSGRENRLRAKRLRSQKKRERRPDFGGDL
ncbi:MAG: aminoacyl-tRNA hydrolase [Spirochaetaceae bacterium]|jgi:ribosome-associated protein|nr:aminoacyl-tRNA hydrolase [Spirochaetaceae bacterium]